MGDNETAQTRCQTGSVSDMRKSIISQSQVSQSLASINKLSSIDGEHGEGRGQVVLHSGAKLKIKRVGSNNLKSVNSNPPRGTSPDGSQSVIQRLQSKISAANDQGSANASHRVPIKLGGSVASKIKALQSSSTKTP
jgi:hypothetical protein